MPDSVSQHSDQQILMLDISRLDDLFGALRAEGFQIVGPVVRDGAICYESLDSVEDLPRGLTDQQAPGEYRLVPRDDSAIFGYNVGPHSWKRFLDPPRQQLWSASRKNGLVQIETPSQERPAYAFVGVRACEIHALRIQDRVYIEGQYQDPAYAARRQAAFIVAVNCTQAGGTCFCTSMGTGPKCEQGFDLALTEVIHEQGHRFVVEIGTERGRALAETLSLEPAPQSLRQRASELIQSAEQSMGRQLNTEDIKELLYCNDENRRWDEVAARCLTCANCTMVCPTCFCSTVEDVTDLTGEHAERWKRWDSCFTLEHSYLHGGSIRASSKSRYRQWLTHKFASWIDQFDTSGCTGCGRCITWCPVGIDVTEEIAAIRSSDIRKSRRTGGDNLDENA
jgi:ferredoxin